MISTHSETFSGTTKKRKRETIVCVSVSVSLTTVISFLYAAVDLLFVCFYGFRYRTEQTKKKTVSVLDFICFLSEWINVIVLACEAKKKRKKKGVRHNELVAVIIKPLTSAHLATSGLPQTCSP